MHKHPRIDIRMIPIYFTAFVFFIINVKYIYSSALYIPNEIEWEVDNRKQIYIKNKSIASSSFAEVLLYEEINENISIAIKAQRLELHSYARELEFYEKLSDENIIQKIFSFKQDGIGYIAFKYFPYTLLDIADEIKNITLIDLKIIHKQLLDPLLYLEGEGVIHNNLKHDNVVVDKDLNIKIIDFGMACYIKDLYKVFKDENLDIEKLKEEYPHCSPERLIGADQNFKTDIYSWGYMLKTSSKLFVSQNQEFLYPDLIDIYEHALQVEVSARPSVDELIFHPFFDEIYNFLFCFNDYEDMKGNINNTLFDKIGNKILIRHSQFEFAIYCGCHNEKNDETVTRLLTTKIHSEKCTVCKTGFKISKYAKFKVEVSGQFFPIHILKMKYIKLIREDFLVFKSQIRLKSNPSIGLQEES
ncbi:protein kinase [Hamiltosporidium tvaerminnensis]|uniref:Protein kinase n=1 Tax=Hamiltosporidium tvaerminnensis TaxID=1176355 RepID=A0A4Q9LVS0_9MICR|nr:protein kinase [Hamiltosporidium tvaerminnensis]